MLFAETVTRAVDEALDRGDLVTQSESANRDHFALVIEVASLSTELLQVDGYWNQAHFLSQEWIRDLSKGRVAVSLSIVDVYEVGLE